MGERIMYFIFSLLCIASGFSVLVDKMVYIKGEFVDFGDMGYFYIIPGVSIICLGFASLYLALRKTPKNYHSTDCVMKCKQCRRTFNYEDTNNGKCPICDIDIETFYENKQFFNIHKNSKRKKRKKKKKPINTTKLNKKMDINSVKLFKNR
ncbi:MAG: hypothetical protein CR967_04205 [Proteobacteria bacterium]|nr:MAG: hypothetical protein CR967_04205 [Pseudomonadota bacterium]